MINNNNNILKIPAEIDCRKYYYNLYHQCFKMIVVKILDCKIAEHV